MTIKSAVQCDGPWCGATFRLVDDEIPTGWVESRGHHFCPATVRLALERFVNSETERAE